MHGLRTPNEAFFHRNPELLGLGRQIGQIGRTISTHFGTVSPFSIISTKNYAFISKSQILGLGRQFGLINFGAFGVFLTDLSAPILIF